MKRTSILSAVLFGSALTVAACGGGDDGDEPQNTAGKGGGSAGSGGGGAGGTIGGGGGAGGITANTAVPNCTKFTKLGEADAFFKMRCGSGSGACHQKIYDVVWQDLESPNVWMRMLDKKPVGACLSEKILNKTDYKKSVMYIKTLDPTLKCPDGKKAGTDPMPPPNMAAYPALTAEEKTCLENFLKAATGM